MRKKRNRRKRQKSKRFQYLTQKEIQKLLRYFRKNDWEMYMITLTAYSHGLRVSEVLSLRREDIDLDRGRIRIRRLKGSLSAEHPLSAQEKMAWDQFLKFRRRGAVFRISRFQVYRRLQQAAGILRISKKKAHPHALKHSLAMHLLEAGVPVSRVQAILGHRNIQNTLIYAQVLDRDRDDTLLSFLQGEATPLAGASGWTPRATGKPKR